MIKYVCWRHLKEVHIKYLQMIPSHVVQLMSLEDEMGASQRDLDRLEMG